MPDMLQKYKWMAPWIAAIGTLLASIVINVWLAGANYGTFMQKQLDFEHRLSRIETSDQTQNEKIQKSSEILSRIETSVDYIRDSIRRGSK